MLFIRYFFSDFLIVITGLSGNFQKLTVEENRYQSAVLISKELLNYNVQVLQKRQDENRVIKGQQKRIVNR